MDLLDKIEAIYDFIGDSDKVQREWDKDSVMVAGVAKNSCTAYEDVAQCTAYKIKIVCASESGSEMNALTSALPMPIVPEGIDPFESYMLAVHAAYEFYNKLPNFIGIIAYSFVTETPEDTTEETLAILAEEGIAVDSLRLRAQAWINWNNDLVPALRVYGCEYEDVPGQSKITKIVELPVDNEYLQSSDLRQDMLTVSTLPAMNPGSSKEIHDFYVHALHQVCENVVKHYQ